MAEKKLETEENKGDIFDTAAETIGRVLGRAAGALDALKADSSALVSALTLQGDAAAQATETNASPEGGVPAPETVSGRPRTRRSRPVSQARPKTATKIPGRRSAGGRETSPAAAANKPAGGLKRPAAKKPASTARKAAGRPAPGRSKPAAAKKTRKAAAARARVQKASPRLSKRAQQPARKSSARGGKKTGRR